MNFQTLKLNFLVQKLKAKINSWILKTKIERNIKNSIFQFKIGKEKWIIEFFTSKIESEND